MRLITTLKTLMAGSALALGAHVQAQTATTAVELYVVDSCKPVAQGGRCALGLVQVPPGVTAPANVQTTCAPGWIVHFMAEQGTVEQGGINRGASLVCGYQDAEAALRAAIKTCNERTFVRCDSANQITVHWARWDGGSLTGQPPTSVAVTVDTIPGAMSCSTSLPIQESDQCQPAAAVQLRSAGLR